MLTPGIEVGKSTPKEYKKNLRKLILYLEGGRHKLLQELEKQMLSAAKAENFEEAAEARKQLFGLKELQKKIVFSDKEFLDISSDHALTDLHTMLRLPNRQNASRGMIFLTNPALMLSAQW